MAERFISKSDTHTRQGSTGFRADLATQYVFMLIGLALVTACSRSTANDPSATSNIKESVPVSAAWVEEQTVPVQILAIGTVEAYSMVSVRSQVEGEITQVHFKEGDDVTQGELLFTIDARTYQAALNQAEADLARDQAQALQAEANLARDMARARNDEAVRRRYADLSKQGVVTLEQYDQVQTNAEASEATVRADRAAVETAQAAVKADQAAIEKTRIQLEYCSIRSPIDGRTGNLMINQGNVVKANDTVLVVINQVIPTYVTFSVPEQNLPEIRKYLARGRLNVEAVIPGEDGSPVSGILTFVDNTVDRTTGTIQLKATFANLGRGLWPGQFVNVILRLTERPKAIVVPSQAAQTGQDGQYVFVVTSDSTAELRPVVLGQTVGDRVVVENGLHPGERVVTDGQLRLTPGTRVVLKNDPAEHEGGRP